MKNCGNCIYAVDSAVEYPPDKYIRSFSLVCKAPIIAPPWLSFPYIQRATEPENGEDCELHKPDIGKGEVK